MTGHTLDDQAETVLLALLRGAGATGLGAMSPGWRHPILSLRRSDTEAVCTHLGIIPAVDPTNDDRRFRRNRVRHELMPLLDDIAARDVAPLLARSAELLRRDDVFLEELAAQIDPTDAADVASAPGVLAARAIRMWLTRDGYPPDAAAVARVIDVARGQTTACEVTGGMRVERRENTLQIFSTEPTSG